MKCQSFFVRTLVFSILAMGCCYSCFKVILDLIYFRTFFLNPSSFLLQNLNSIDLVKKGCTLQDLFMFNLNNEYRSAKLKIVWIKQIRIFFEAYRDVILPIRFGYKIDYNNLRGFHSLRDVIKEEKQIGFFSSLYSSLYTKNQLKRVQFEANPVYNIIVKENLSLNLKKVAEQLNYELNTKYVYRGTGDATSFIVSVSLHNGVFLPLVVLYDMNFENVASIQENVMFSATKLLDESKLECCNNNLDRLYSDYVVDNKHSFNITLITYRFCYEFVRTEGGVMPYHIDSKLVAIPMPTQEIFLGDLRNDKNFEIELKSFIEYKLPKLYYRTDSHCPFMDHLLRSDTYFVTVLNCEYTTFETLAGLKLDTID